VKTFTQMEGLKPEYVRVFPGSSEPLHFSVLAFTSPTKSYVTADPGYEAGMKAANVSGARIVKTALTKSHSHDIKAMLAGALDAGLFYVCTPNNPTGTMTSHSDIEQLVAAKPKGSVVLVDEAYIHFSDGVSALDLVKADQDVIVLRTFSRFTEWPASVAAWPSRVRSSRETRKLQRLERLAHHCHGRRHCQPQARASRPRAQTVERRHPPKNLRLALQPGLFLHSLAVQLFYA